MMALSTWSDLITIVGGVVGLLAVVLPVTIGIVRNHRGFVGWRRIEKAIERLHRQMVESGYRPTNIVCLGRAGSIVGALLSERFELPNVPIATLTFTFAAQSPEGHHGGGTVRIERQLRVGDLHDGLENVLLISTDIVSGGTMQRAIESLAERRITCTATACLYWDPDAKVRPTFYVEKRAQRLTYPWNQRTFAERYGLPIAE